jgi:hypothetical protein
LTTTSLRLHRRAPRFRQVSHWPAWAAPRWQITSTRRPGHPSSGHTCRRSTTIRQIHRNLAGLRHRHYDSRWRHHHNGDILPCCLVWAGPDLAHEPFPRIDLLLGRALCAVHGKLRQCLPAAWCGGPPPRSEVGAQGNSPGLHLPLHQGTGHHTSYIRCFHHHYFPPGGM